MVSDNQDLGFIVADQNDTPIRLTISIALFLSVWMQLRQPSHTSRQAYQYYRSKTDRRAVSALGYLRVDYQ